MGNIKGFSCVACDNVMPPSPQLVYECDKCGANLQVVYDYEALKKKLSPNYFKGIERKDVWRYIDLLPVSEDSPKPPLTIGWTPIYEVKRLGKELGHENLFIKDESRNPSASFKDRASSVALVKGLELEAEVMTGASTGNAGSSMACLAASMGISPVIFVPEKAPKAKVAQLLLFGAKVLAVRGTYDQAFDLCLEATRKYGWYNRNTGYNPYTREGKKTCSLEIAEQFDWQVPDVVAVSVGDGNIISGLWKGFKDLLAVGLIDRLPRLLAVQSSKSNAVAQAFSKGLDEVEPVSATTIADSISVDLPRDGLAALNAVKESKGFAVEVSDETILSTIATCARFSGVFGEPAGVTAVAGVEEAAKQGLLQKEWKVVTVMTGSGLKDVDSALKAAGEPMKVDPDPSKLEEISKMVKGK